jgi:ankyrin repeat protein
MGIGLKRRRRNAPEANSARLMKAVLLTREIMMAVLIILLTKLPGARLSRTSLIIHTDKDGQTPLHHASWTGHTEVAKVLVDKRADINAKSVYSARLSRTSLIIHTDKDGQTPLHHASWKGHTEVAKVLVDKGADINAKSVYSACLSHTSLNIHTHHEPRVRSGMV